MRFPFVPAIHAVDPTLRAEETEPVLPGGTWYTVSGEMDHYYGTSGETNRIEYRFAPGRLAGMSHLCCDILTAGHRDMVFNIVLQEGNGPRALLAFWTLCECQARMALPAAALDMNAWQIGRRGAWMKPMLMGDRVDLTRVDRIVLQVARKAEGPRRFCMTPLTAVDREPEALTDPLLPKGALIDELGQSTLHDWPGKTRGVEELATRLRGHHDEADAQQWPADFTRWGGWRARRLTGGSGFFATHHDGARWWLVDPDGHAFWSAGLDCVRATVGYRCDGVEKALAWRPEETGDYAAACRIDKLGRTHVDYLAANLIRVFGPEKWKEAWERIAFSLLKGWGFNTVGNWSDSEAAGRARFPYVHPLSPRFEATPRIFRDFPDVFHPDFRRDAATYAEQLLPFKDDPTLVGYFLMNEPQWGFAAQSPAEGMLFNTPHCRTREALASWLREKYGSDEALAAAWGLPAACARIAGGDWSQRLTETARADMEAFSTRMVRELFSTLNEACKRVAPHHLNLGARYYTVPPAWALPGMEGFDVFSVNCYRPQVPDEFGEAVASLSRPLLVGEWHFGALDAGLPGSGIGRVATQADRGKAYRVYLEQAAAKPWCVGVHYFTLYDEAALGRFDGEDWNIGFLDVCHRVYEPLAAAARAAHERLYAVATDEAAPCDDAPEYLPPLFC